MRLLLCRQPAYRTDEVLKDRIAVLRGLPGTPKVREAESNIELLDLVSTPAAADRDAAFTVKRVKLQESTAKALRRNREFDTTTALKARFKPSTHLAVRLPALHMTLSQADPTGSMTPWRQF